MKERLGLERELGDLRANEHFFWPFPPVPTPTVPPPTVGFEFDVHYGPIAEVVAAAGKTMPNDGDAITKHTWAKDGFKTTLDGPRIEIATKPLNASATGRPDFETVMKNVLTFASELQSGCKTAAVQSVAVADAAGNPRAFTLSDTVVPGLPLSRLWRMKPRRFDPKVCNVWAAPQATIAVRLSRVDAFIKAIQDGEGESPGVSLTGGKRYRLGVRSDAIFKARDAVRTMRRNLIKAKPQLSDGTIIDDKVFSDDLAGFLMLIVSYLIVGELPRDQRDYEPFAKAYLPLNVKAPFSSIFAQLLTARDRQVFRELFADGAARVRLFQMARRGAVIGDGKNLLFASGPPVPGETLGSVHLQQQLPVNPLDLKHSGFGSVPTWDDLVEHTLDSKHKTWGDRLLVSLSNIIDLKNTQPRIAIEMRRLGFDQVFDWQWRGLMQRVYALAEKLR
jgi:hypothetical protein